MKQQKKKHIVMIDDDSEDAYLMRRAITAIDEDVGFQHVSDSEAFLMSISQQHGEYASASVLLVDLNMPGIDGFEVIEAARASKQFQQTQIVMLTSSRREEDCKRAIALGADRFATKPNSSRDMMKLVESILQ